MAAQKRWWFSVAITAACDVSWAALYEVHSTDLSFHYSAKSQQSQFVPYWLIHCVDFYLLSTDFPHRRHIHLGFHYHWIVRSCARHWCLLHIIRMAQPDATRHKKMKPEHVRNIWRQIDVADRPPRRVLSRHNCVADSSRSYYYPYHTTDKV